VHERVHKNGLEKPYSWYLVISQAFYKEWAEISMECVAIVNHKRVIYWVINYRTMKYVLEKHDGWHGAMVWRHHDLVKSWEGLIYVVMHTLHKLNHHRGSSMHSRGKSPRLKGNPNFHPSLSFNFFQRSTYRLKCNMFKFDIFPNSFTIFRGSRAFSRH